MCQFLNILEAGCPSQEKTSRHSLTVDSYELRLPERQVEHDPIERTIAYLIEHLTQQHSVNQLAALAGISPSHFFTLFKRQTGYTPIKFLIHLRMRKACRFLHTTDLNVKQIAGCLGYNDEFYFSRLFKSVTQVAPTEYRLLLVGAKERILTKILPTELNGRRASFFAGPSKLNCIHD